MQEHWHLDNFCFHAFWLMHDLQPKTQQHTDIKMQAIALIPWSTEVNKMLISHAELNKNSKKQRKMIMTNRKVVFENGMFAKEVGARSKGHYGIVHKVTRCYFFTQQSNGVVFHCKGSYFEPSSSMGEMTED